MHPAEPSDDSVLQPAVAASRRCLTLAFDKTYILQSLDVVKLAAGRGFVGGAWQCPYGTEGANSKDASFLPLRAEGSEGSKLAESGEDEGQVALDAANITYAREVCKFLTWNPSLTSLHGFPSAAYRWRTRSLLCKCFTWSAR